MKVITFTKQLIPLVLNGSKTQTRRKMYYSTKGNAVHKYEVNDICLIKNSRFKKDTYGYIKIIRVESNIIKNISEQDAIAEGFQNRNEFFDAWNKIHPDWNPGWGVWIIEFKYFERLPNENKM